MRRFILCLLGLVSFLSPTLHASVLIPTIESWGLNGSSSQVYLPGGSISISVSVGGTRTNPAQDNTQVVNIYVSKVQNSITSPAVHLGSVTCSIPAGTTGGGPTVNQSFTVPTTYGSGSITAGTYYIVFSAVGSNGSSVESSAFTIGIPDIALQSPSGTNLTNHSSTISFGDAAVGQTLLATVIVSNPGSAPLTGITPTISGTNAGDFSLTSLPATSLAAGASSSFHIQLVPTAAGTRTASLSIASSVTGAKNPFVVALSGTGDLAPTATTEPATNVTDTGAVLNGTVNANGTSTTTSFEYGPTTSYGSRINGMPTQVTGTVATEVTATLSALPVGGTLHFRVDAVSAGGTVEGADQTLTTESASSDSPAMPTWGLAVLAIVMLAAGMRRMTPRTGEN